MRIAESVSLAAPAITASIDVVTFEGANMKLRAAEVYALADLPPLSKSLVYTGTRTMIYFGAHSIIVRGTAQTINSALNAALATALVAVDLPYVLVADVKANGTAGGTFTSGAWRTRVINTKLTDTHNLCAINTPATNQFQLQAGTWRFFATLPAHRVNVHRARLQNIIDNTTVRFSDAAVSEVALVNVSYSNAVLFGDFIIASAKAFELQHWCQTTQATDGFGVHDQGIADGVSEYFARGEFWRIAA